MVVEEAARAAAAVAAATPPEEGVPITDSTKPDETDFWCLKLSCFLSVCKLQEDEDTDMSMVGEGE